MTGFSVAVGDQNATSAFAAPPPDPELTIDSGWREVAQTALDFVKRFV